MKDNRLNEHEPAGAPGSASFDRALLADLVHGRIPPEESQRLLDIVAADEELSRELELAILLLNEGARRPADQHGAYPPEKPTSRRVREAAPFLPMVFRVAAAILVCLGLGWYADAVTSPPYAAAARVSPADLHVRVRAGGSGVVSGSRAYLLAGDWRECVRRVDWYLAVYPDGEELPSASILKGAAYLMGARSHILGFHVRYEQALVDSALASLQHARSRHPAPGLEDEIDWFEAKAMLMKGDCASATSKLDHVARRHGARADDARKLLRELATGG